MLHCVDYERQERSVKREKRFIISVKGAVEGKEPCIPPEVLGTFVVVVCWSGRTRSGTATRPTYAGLRYSRAGAGSNGRYSRTTNTCRSIADRLRGHGVAGTRCRGLIERVRAVHRVRLQRLFLRLRQLLPRRVDFGGRTCAVGSVGHVGDGGGHPRHCAGR